MNIERSTVLAYACGAILAAASAAMAQAQDAPNVSSLEEVVVTGSLIKGTPEDKAIPVEVVTYEELQDLGRPSNLDLVKTMSEVGQVAGEANRGNAYPMGAATINLRSLGARFTTVLFNGRRFPEQTSVATGRFNNISWIPNAVVGSVETLKAGGGVTYGADAVSGVVNYISRKNVDGLELNADYRYINDSDGDYTADALWGKQYAGGNLMVSVAYQHRSPLKAIDRDWAVYPYLVNPVGYSAAGTGVSNPGSYVVQVPIAGTQTAITPAVTTGAALYQGNYQMGANGLVRDPNCSALGGFAGWSAAPTTGPSCFTNSIEGEQLVTETDNVQLYLEHNHEFDFGLKFHTEALALRFKPTAAISSANTGIITSWPLVGPATTPNRSMQAVGTTNAYFVPGYHPAVAGVLNGIPNSGTNPGGGNNAFTTGQINSVLNGGQIALLNAYWKPFGVGGNPYPDADVQKNDTKLWRISESISGNLPEFWGTKLEWEVGLTYTHVYDVRDVKDILVDRLQAALNGLGGPNCTGTAPGLNGCQFFNPFPSAYSANAFTGAGSPSFVPGLANDPNLVKWLYVPIYLERTYQHFLVDPIIRGDTGIELPGGNILFALGAQFRMQSEELNLDEYSQRLNFDGTDKNPCSSVGVTNCSTASRVGVLALGRPGSVLGAAIAGRAYQNDKRRYPVRAGFLETQLPILDSLSLTLASRFEKFYSDVTDRNNEVFIPAAAIKWQPLDWLGVRTSWGKTFTQVNPPRPGAATTVAVAANTTYGVTALGHTALSYPNLDVKPEKGQYLDVGFLINLGNFNANVDYYDIQIDDYARTMALANVYEALVMPGETDRVRAIGGSALGTQLINCSSSLLSSSVASLNNRPFVQLNTACVQGTTTISAINGTGSTINYFSGTGQTNTGKLKTKGVDLSARYRFDNVFGGTLTTSIDYSRILAWKLGDFVIAGVKVADGYDGLGFTNTGTGRIAGASVAKYRGTFGVAYRFDIHTLNILTNYIKGIVNDSDTDFVVGSSRNANIGNAQGFTTAGGTGAAACTVTPAAPFATDIGSVPAGAGTGVYGGPGRIAGSVGYCAAQNALVDSGHEIDDIINVDLIYRVQLPSELSMTLTINNLLDRDPPFYRAAVPYSTAYGSPLERNYKIGFSKKF